LKFLGISTIRLGIALMLVGALVACGGTGGAKKCDKPKRYQESVQNERLKSPEGLDSLDALREMPVPEANPAPERPDGSPCLELPPRIFTTEGNPG
jgi:hypothetical protein